MTGRRQRRERRVELRPIESTSSTGYLSDLIRERSVEVYDMISLPGSLTRMLVLTTSQSLMKGGISALELVHIHGFGNGFHVIDN